MKNGNEKSWTRGMEERRERRSGRAVGLWRDDGGGGYNKGASASVNPEMVLLNLVINRQSGLIAKALVERLFKQVQ